MSNQSQSLQAILQRNQKKMRETRTIIKESKDDVPVLSAIVDYGGQSSVDEILTLDQQDKEEKHYNNFQKILHQSKQNSDQAKSRKFLSFIEYKYHPSKANLSKSKKSRKVLKSSIVVQMPQQLKQMKNQILSLPSVSQSRYVPPKQNNSGSRILQDLKKIQSRRYATESSQPLNQFQKRKQTYLINLKDILSQFQSPQIQCNSYIKARHDECKRILQHEQALSNQYKRFEKLGSPSKRIISLKQMLNKFQNTIDHSLDTDLARQLNNMDSKRYDIVLKHEQQVKKYNLAKFQQRRKQQKIQQSKNPFVEFHISEKLGFKLNSKGKQIYTNKMKTVK